MRTITRILADPGRQVEHACDVRDPGAAPGLVVAVVSRLPRPGGHYQDRFLHVLGNGHADEVAQRPGPPSQPGEELVRTSAGVRPDQILSQSRRGSCRVASTWSAAVHEAALPTRSTMARGWPFWVSPWSTQAVIGWKPKVLSGLGPSALVPSAQATIVASKSTMTRPSLSGTASSVSPQARSRAAARGPDRLQCHRLPAGTPGRLTRVWFGELDPP